MRYLVFAILILPFVSPIHAGSKHLHPEKWYQEKWCNERGGVTEYVLPDKTRVDCLTDEYAVEADFAKKWAESIGQALFYGYMTGKKPGVLLILEKEKDKRYLKRLNKVADKEGITVWTISP
ncbi:MAG: hypothetical protein KAV87_21000 [Desulfobacteraceae bacterium]|nr:hypothetical protein [Desulfobacteraceae bacterium]